jgi:hypothetical protein
MHIKTTIIKSSKFKFILDGVYVGDGEFSVYRYIPEMPTVNPMDDYIYYVVEGNLTSILESVRYDYIEEKFHSLVDYKNVSIGLLNNAMLIKFGTDSCSNICYSTGCIEFTVKDISCVKY